MNDDTMISRRLRSTAAVLTAALTLGICCPVGANAGLLDMLGLGGPKYEMAEVPEGYTYELGTDAPGILEKRCGTAVVDYSNTADGYVMVMYTADTQEQVKVQVKGASETYTYNILPHEWASFPLSEGDGDYTVSIFEDIGGSRFALVLSASFSATLSNEFAPFLRPNQYVNYSDAPETVALAFSLTGTTDDTLEMVRRVYDYVTETLKYDRELAATVKSGYLPEMDKILEKKSGICFDYASLMTGMLRSRGVPCKLVVGYAGTVYHAWISVWVDDTGWLDNAIFFDGVEWQRMDPTFASGGGREAAAYIGDGTNYTAKFFY